MKMKATKKVISILLCAVLLAGMFTCFSAFAEGANTLKIAVASDIHTIVLPDALPDEDRDEGLYWQSSGAGALYYEAVAVLRTFVDEAKANGAQYILLSGDLCTDGTVAQYEHLSKVLAELEKSSGIPIFVTPGNHDFQGDGIVESFKQYFADFGFNEALAVDEKTASYTADLDGGYRLISIDSNDHKTNGADIDKRLTDWIKQQAKQAQSDGKKLIAMMHHPLMEHINFHSLIMPAFIVNNWKYMSGLFADLGIKYCFTGHVHNNDIAMYTSINGNEVYDVTTGTLTSLRPCYRLVTFSDSGVEFKLNEVKSVKREYLINGYNEAQLQALTTDLQAYALGCFDYCLEAICKQYLDVDFLNGLTKNLLSGVIGRGIPRVNEAIFLPFRTTDGGKSFSEIAAAYGITLPDVGDKNLFSIAMDACHAYYIGDTHIDVDDELVDRLVNGVYAALTYIFDGISADDQNTILSAVFGALGIDFDALGESLSAQLGLKDIDGIALTKAILKPVAEGFLLDEYPDDSNVTLPAYSEPKAADFTVAFSNAFTRITQGLKAVINYLLTILAFFK